MEVNKLLFAIVFLVMVMGLASAAQPVTQVTSDTDGLVISFPKQSYLPQNQPFKLHTTVINITGEITNDTTDCFFHLYNRDGSHITKSQMDYEPNGGDLGEYEIYIEAANFSEVGEHPYIIQCTSLTQAGFASGEFIVNAQGKEYDVTYSIIFVSLLVLAIGIFLLSLYGFIKIPYENYRDEENFIRSINYMKYLKILSFAVMYVMFVAITYFAWSVTFGILEFTEMANIFYWLFKTSYIAAYVLIPVVFVLGGIQLILDLKIAEKVERGLSIS